MGIFLGILGNCKEKSTSLRGGTTKQSLDFVIQSSVEGSVRELSNRCFDYAQHDMREDCFVPRNDERPRNNVG